MSYTIVNNLSEIEDISVCIDGNNIEDVLENIMK